MNKLKKIIFILILSTFINTVSFSKENAFIIYNINNELITNIDLKKEANYLVALNNQLKTLGKKQILEIAEESIVRETIKKIELNKYFDLKRDNPLVEEYLKNFYLRLRLKNKNEFKEYLQNNGLTVDFVRKKIQIEITWNKLIYEKFRNQVKIDEKEIRKEIELNNDNKLNKKLYLLSEIVFEIKNKDAFNQKKNNINKSIKEIGFKNSANIYSIADSSKFGGQIDWIAEKQISKQIYNKISDLKIGEHSNPIRAGSSFLILKINDIKYEESKMDIKQEINKRIEIETERQLQQYSKIHYNKIKINTNINEL
jgi:peptidyl-prolyl cis-trans isomerase SurA